MTGVVRTHVGYTGGRKLNPTYRQMGDHTESLQIDYDPAQISFEEIMNVFWRGHRPTRPSWSKQYRSAIFFHNETQRAIAERTCAAYSAEIGQKVYTAIEPANTFYLAEDCHQKYSLQSQPGLMSSLRQMYPEFEDFNNSTAAARLNGYVCGYGDLATLRSEMPTFGLPAAEQVALLKRFSRF